ncbi:MAG: hypothetical protein HRU38_18685 [Saccharospirillaceae bacterium]|nr:hypothetical protein [Saccharospirillaceae bacterium]
MSKKVLTSIIALSFITAMTSCESDDETDNGDSTDTQSDTTQTYAQLLDVVAQSIDEHANCAVTCHTASGQASHSGLVFNSTSASDVEAALTNYIALDFKANTITIKSYPAGAVNHPGGNIWANNLSGQTSFEELIEQISENVLEDLTSPVTALVNNSACSTCHADASPFGVEFIIGNTATNSIIQSSIPTVSYDISAYPFSLSHTGLEYASEWSESDKDAWTTLVNAL